MRHPARGALTLSVALLAAGALAHAGDEGTPTPSPVPEASPRPTPVVITNETLSQYSAGGHVTEVTSVTPVPGSRAAGRKDSTSRPFGWDHEQAGPAAAPPPPPADAARDEAEQSRYWRGLYEQQLDLLRSMREQIDALDREIPALWRDFYARDDPMYRDGVIKPKLDQALEQRQRLEERLGQEQERLPEILEHARRAGAKPGWFRGLEQPTPGPERKKPGESVEPEDVGGVKVVDPDQT